MNSRVGHMWGRAMSACSSLWGHERLMRVFGCL